MEKNITTADTRETLVQDVGKLKQDAVQIAQDVKAHAAAHVDQTKKRVTDAAGALHDRAAEHPFALLATGFVLGYLFAFSRRS